MNSSGFLHFINIFNYIIVNKNERSIYIMTIYIEQNSITINNNKTSVTKIKDVICQHCIKSIFPEQNKLIQLKDVYVINPNKNEQRLNSYGEAISDTTSASLIQFDSWNDMLWFISANHITELYVKNDDKNINSDSNNHEIMENNYVIHDLLTLWQPVPSITLEDISTRLLEIESLICQTFDDLYDKCLIEYNNE